mgnify:CR=1 FL=1
MNKTLLHVGCGPKTRQHTTPGFRGEGWDEIRLDIDVSVQPDIVGTMTDLSGVDDASVDAVLLTASTMTSRPSSSSRMQSARPRMSMPQRPSTTGLP